MLRVPVTGVSYDLDIVQVNSSIQAVEFALDLDKWSSPNVTERIVGITYTTDTYSIYAQLCLPNPAKDKHVMQILSHGLAFDHRYCTFDSRDFVGESSVLIACAGNPTISPAQSYVLAAMQAGYTVLNYDRLGSGSSEKSDAYKIVQGPLEVEVLRVLTEMVRDGSLTAASNCPSTHLPAFTNVVHVGHSFGSAITLALLAEYGHLSSAAISTGFIIAEHPNQDSSTAFGFEYAATNDPGLWSDYGSGYIVPATVSDLQTTFFHRENATDPAGFSDKMLAYGESIKQPLTVAKWTSIRGLLNIGYAPEFTGPLQFFLAEYDFLICDGDCVDNYDPTLINGLYPNSTGVDIYVQPGAGHGLTLHRNASAGYAVMLDWLEYNGL